MVNDSTSYVVCFRCCCCPNVSVIYIFFFSKQRRDVALDESRVTAMKEHVQNGEKSFFLISIYGSFFTG